MSLSLQKSWAFFFPKDQIWVDNVEESLPGVVLVPAQEEAASERRPNLKPWVPEGVEEITND